MTPSLQVRWDRLVTHPARFEADTIVHCIATDGTPVELRLDYELREALALILLDPNAEMDQS